MTEGNGLINVTIDGIEIAVEPGTHVIDAAERAGVLIPRYCYHPGIPTRPAQCRVCLVEIEGQPKLQPSCKMTVQEGMVVLTASEEAEDARRAVIELLLVNHPLDCPICDAAGQCMLQDYALETEQLRSRLHEEKLVQGRDRIADDILYFADRCIICTRCVRFMSEVAGDEALIVAQRGGRRPRARGLPLQGPLLGHGSGSLDLPRLLDRLQRHDRRQGESDRPAEAAPQPGGQLLLDVRPRSETPRHVQPWGASRRPVDPA
jgi:NADH-quinone oxidoreductase subunit G